MGTSGSSCKGSISPADSGQGQYGQGSTSGRDPREGKQARVYAKAIPLPTFQERQPFNPEVTLCLADASLLKAITHHRTPFAAVDLNSEELIVVHVSGGFVSAMGLKAEAMEGKPLAKVLMSGIKATASEVEELATPLRAREDTSLVMKRAAGNHKSNYTQFFVTPISDTGGNAVYGVIAVEPVHGPEADPSLTMPYRFRRAWQCLTPSNVWSLFTPYKRLCKEDESLIKALQDRREMFCITDPELYDNPIIFVSDDFVDMTGYNREEINGINCRFLQGEMTSTEDVDVIRYGIREETNMRVCLLNYRKNGTAFLNQFNLSCLRDVSGNVAFFIGVQIEVEDAEIMPFPTTRQSLHEMLLEEDEEFWDEPQSTGEVKVSEPAGDEGMGHLESE